MRARRGPACPGTLRDAIDIAVEELGLSYEFVDLFVGIPIGTTATVLTTRHKNASAICEALGIQVDDYDQSGFLKGSAL